ncbi:MAG: hypothetical protein IBX45_14025 [Campylobacterales bacterium]|nr:hypothetical protein [Campylobacterales bacterium]
MKILFIPNLPYTLRDHKRFGVEFFLSRGYGVEVMDVHKVLMPGYKEKVNIEYYTFDKHWEPKDESEIIERVKKLSEEDIIFFYGNEVRILHVMKFHTKAKFMTYVGGSIPTSTVFCSKVLYFKLQFKKFIKSLIPKYRIKPFSTDYFVSGSPKDELVFPYLIGKNTKIYQSNSRDYNLCLKSKPFASDEKYCVFLDTDALDASDYVLFGEDKKGDFDAYFKKLIGFFGWVEREFGVKVIISAHPKSRIYKDKNEIQGIKVVHEKSVELVQGSEFVITEGTTAISYGVFFKKPLIIFTFKEISFFHEHCCTFAKELNKAIVNIDNLDKKIFLRELENTSGYDYYKFNYLTYKDERTDTFEMIEKELFLP